MRKLIIALSLCVMLGACAHKQTASEWWENDVERNGEPITYIEIIMLIEKEYEIEIPDEEAEKFTKIKDLVDYVWQHNLEKQKKALPFLYQENKEVTK